MKKKKICVVTGSRAEYGLLYWPMKFIQNDTQLELQIIATGMHLSPDFGLTYKEIEKDGFNINCKLEMLLSSDRPSAISKSTGLGLISFAETLENLKPDILLILGDRYEILPAAIAANFSKIPVAHIHGGETTEGAFDEFIRHSITKMSWWHFVACEDYKKRVIQLGENPERVFNVGGLGVDLINKIKLLSKKELIEKTKIKFLEKNLLVTFHPTTLDKQNSKKSFRALLDALDQLNDIGIIFTMPNADPDSKIIFKMINEFVSINNHRSVSFKSMGHLNYLSTMQFVDGVVGNSSSGLIEAPSLNIGTVNIGDRQKGRVKAKSIIDCDGNRKSIRKAIETLYSDRHKKNISKNKNPYEKGESSERIVKILKSVKLPDELKKEFYNL